MLASWLGPGAAAQTGDSSPQPRPALTYGAEGLEFRTPRDGFRAVLGWRNQLRFTTPFADAPSDAAELPVPRKREFALNRSRLRLNGHAFTPRLTYQFQYDFVEHRARDLSVTYALAPWAYVRAGRWKVEYSRERITSSGAQHLVDRSIVDRWFTVGRQQGIEVFGRVENRPAWGGEYWVGAFRSVADDTGGLPVWLARYQWNLGGRSMAFEPADLDRSRDLHLAVALAAVRHAGRFALYEGSGVGATLGGLPRAAGAERYVTHQYTTDVSVKWRGAALQAEMHRKHVRTPGRTVHRRLSGGYVQGGVFVTSLWEAAPRPLEIAGRWAYVNPEHARADDGQSEALAGVNWYVRGHRNKISIDTGRLRYDTPTGMRVTDLRTRVQWEVTF